MSANTTINLVRGRRPRVLDQFVGWALTIGRAVVILTELVALGAFLYRFGLDRQLVDLHDKIAQEQSIVDLLKQNEDSYRNLQYRLSLAKTVISDQEQSVKLYADVVNMIPNAASLKTMIIDQGSVKVTLEVPTITALSTFVDQMKNYSQFTSVSLDRIENKTSVGIISANVSGTLKGAPPKQP
jgi:Tfp pilus assembly protein PilN